MTDIMDRLNAVSIVCVDAMQEIERLRAEKKEIIDYANTIDWLNASMGDTANEVRLLRFLQLMGVSYD